MSNEEKIISQNNSLYGIMIKQNVWQLKQKKGDLCLQDDQNYKHNITPFKQELINLIYFINNKFIILVENTKIDLQNKFFQSDYLYDPNIQLNILFANQQKYLELFSNLKLDKDFKVEIQNLYEKQSLEFTFQGHLRSIRFTLLKDNIQTILTQLDEDFNKLGGSIHVDTIEIQPHKYNSLNDKKNLIIEQDLALELKNINFDNLLFNCYFNKSSYQKTNEQIIQINLNLSQNINMLKMQVSGRQKIDINLKNKVQKIIPILEIQFVSLQKKSETVDISCIVNRKKPFTTYRIRNASNYSKLLDLDKDYQLIIFIAEEIDNQRVMILKRIRDNFNQAKLQLHAFYKYIEEYLLFHPDQHRYDLYECYDQLIC